MKIGQHGHQHALTAPRRRVEHDSTDPDRTRNVRYRPAACSSPSP